MSIVYLESPSTDPDFNLALEQYVFDKLPRSNEYFMLWQNDNAIIVGKHQNTLEEINQTYVREHGIRVVRRLSGGGAVYHDLGNINYTFIVDAKGSKSLDFAVFCRQVVKALATLGVEAEVSGRNDITIGGKKFSGNSQYIKKGRIMHHGTIMFDSDLAVVAAALKVGKDKFQSKGVKSVRARVTNVREHIQGDITLAQFWHVLRQFMVEEQNMTAYQLTGSDLAQIEELRQSRYATWEWNYGVSPKYSICKERRIEGCGTIKIGMEVEKGIITAFATYGDYFGLGDSADVANALIGQKVEEQALLMALAALPMDYYYNNLTREELVDIILK